MSAENMILVTGATGFIGSRLVDELYARGHALRVLVRRDDALFPPGVEVARGDLFDAASVAAACADVETAVYLVHSLGTGIGRFAEKDRVAARTFTDAASAAGVRRIVYLGGLGEPEQSLSVHLESRMEVAGILRSGLPALTFLRAAIVIGKGGASYAIIRDLIRRFPVLPVPREIYTLCQPIGVRDVIAYLAGCIETPETAGQTFDIGGPDIMTYRDMLERFARVAGSDFAVVPSSLLSVEQAAVATAAVTRQNRHVARALIEGLKNEVICTERRIERYVPLELATYEEAVQQALEEERCIM